MAKARHHEQHEQLLERNKRGFWALAEGRFLQRSSACWALPLPRPTHPQEGRGAVSSKRDPHRPHGGPPPQNTALIPWEEGSTRRPRPDGPGMAAAPRSRPAVPGDSPRSAPTALLSLSRCSSRCPHCCVALPSRRRGPCKRSRRTGQGPKQKCLLAFCLLSFCALWRCCGEAAALCCPAGAKAQCGAIPAARELQGQQAGRGCAVGF